ncbi:MAG: hypothetical protein AAGK04_02440 [Planctomycetota bacterium]
MFELAVVVAALAGPLTPPAGAVGSSYKTLDQVEPRTAIESLPFTITQPGSYYLTGDLSSAGNGIIVNASDVTIDLMGFTITGSDPTQFSGIEQVFPFGNKNLTVRNGTVRNFDDGVVAFTGSFEGYGITFENLRVIDVTSRGIAAGASNCLIVNCYARQVGAGTGVFGGEGLGCVGGVIVNCRASGFSGGIIVNQGVMSNCHASDNDFGIQCIDGVVNGCVSTDSATQNLFLAGSAISVDTLAP